ncbi:hypothetical protein [Peterkaempfera griseoplana]|uniref:hypothetical protein n=1 Tax=Peterkaempfera griseoplana TaxID=66896 RepID=UPI0006E3C2C7|nr:hypothetical protein [Peterkaempfera griseoplana]
MERATILGRLASGAGETALPRLTALAAELDLPLADLLVVARHPVPADLLPPERDLAVMKQFAHRVSHCDHLQLAALEDFARSLPRVAAPGPFVQPVSRHHPPAGTGFAAVLNGLLRNRGSGIRELPFMGLSLSTLYGMAMRWEPGPHRRQQLCAMAGPLGWTLPDMFAIAAEPYAEELRPMLLCRHVGRVFTAAAPLTTAQLMRTAEQADRLSGRRDRDAWQPVSQGFAEECPDFL